MKLGVYSICLPDLTPEQAVHEAKAATYAGIEWRVGVLPDPAATPDFFTNNRCTLPPTPEALARTASRCESAGLRIIGLGTYVEAGDLDGVAHGMELARACGAPWIRLRAPWRTGERFAGLFDRALGFFSGVERLARRTGVRGLLEIHQRSIAPSASLAERLVSRLDPDCVGVIYDAGNLVLEGYEDHRMAVELLGPHLTHVHLKNAAFDRPPGGGVWQPRWTPMNDGVLDVPALLRVLVEAGYDGWVSVEDFSTDRSPVEALHFNADFLRQHGDFEPPVTD
ncbi:sugar phosphate isomerase/epimerase family protein [Amycolatopsis taiwanensis]|uniref:sugar phosphate isomerase/epimerase family protein n=1 Tax=Amycolatopsis taiwanensis TaxID=342230 RepID=UPI0004871598|nr:sugar phosphate isomerase/epimerase [Amycolatopsis taiwanensis]